MSGRCVNIPALGDDRLSITSKGNIVRRDIKRIAGKRLKVASKVCEEHLCKKCGSTKIIKWGKDRDGQQRHKCKDCGNTYTATESFSRMRTPYRIIASALEMYFEGLSIRKTQRMLKKIYGRHFSPNTIHHWIKKYVPMVDDFSKALKPGTSGDWATDETMVLLRRKGWNRRAKDKKKKSYHEWAWAVIDKKTRYILGNHFSRTRTMDDIITNFADARDNALNGPIEFTSDGVMGYERALKRVFGWRNLPDHFKGPGLKGKSYKNNDCKKKIHNNLQERYWGEIKDRTKPMRGMVEGKTILNGLKLHHNFIRPHTSLKGMTPAQAAGLHLPFEDGWGDLIQFSHIYKAGTTA